MNKVFSNRKKHLEWYQIYYLLAAFDLITIGASLLLNHQLAQEYNSSVATNRIWVKRLREISDLARIGADLNAPGNDVFRTMNVDDERVRLEQSLYRLEEKMQSIQADFYESDPIIPASEYKLLAEAETALCRMGEVSKLILNLVETGKIQQATERMAEMDKQYYYAANALRTVGLKVSEIQQASLDDQATRLRSIRTSEQWIALAIVFMVAGTLYYGKRLALQAQRENEEREQHLSALQVAHTELEIKTVDLESALIDLKQAEEELVASEQKFRAIFDNAFQFIGLTSEDGILYEVNQTALDFAGVKREQVLGLYFWDTPWWSHSKKLQDRLRTAVLEARTGKFIRFETENRNYAGEAVPVDFSLQPVLDHNGKVVLLIPEAREMKEKKEAEQRVSEFYSTVSHELRSPLTAIHGALALIEGGLAGEVSEKTMVLVKVAVDESERLIRLINDILDLRKIEAGMLALKKQQVATARMVERTVETLRPIADLARVTLCSKLETVEPVLCDEDRITQVLTNLISNAIKFSPPGSEVSVLVEKTSHNTLRFSVVDDGQGIPQELMHKLFKKFQQLDQTDKRKCGGTGLGLAISKALVEQHGGRIGALNREPKGAEFWFEIPAQAATTPQSQECRVIKESVANGE